VNAAAVVQRLVAYHPAIPPAPAPPAVCSLLHLAARCNDAASIRLLARPGSDIDVLEIQPDESMVTALHAACRASAVDAVAALLALGADVNRPAVGGVADVTPLLAAVGSGCREVAELLVAAGADMNAESKVGSVLSLAVASSLELFQVRQGSLSLSLDLD
jgi:ankyrin repeat protein